MRGKTDEQILTERNKAIELAVRFIGEDVELIDSFIPDTPENLNSIPLWYLGRSIQFLAEADVAYFAPGWREARGCVIEHECATQYGVRTVCSYDER
ncbi:hypothetical protein [Kineothrix sedimenti]|uniref:DUF4406 domain-containing protein n=1 Tax=Kineothrix sedimenti TaxID=3123317 RepID=A0ABZ3ETU7_9FIRM